VKKATGVYSPEGGQSFTMKGSGPGGAMTELDMRDVTCPSCAAVVHVYAGSSRRCDVCDATVYAN